MHSAIQQESVVDDISILVICLTKVLLNMGYTMPHGQGAGWGDKQGVPLSPDQLNATAGRCQACASDTQRDLLPTSSSCSNPHGIHSAEHPSHTHGRRMTVMAPCLPVRTNHCRSQDPPDHQMNKLLLDKRQ